MSLIIVIIYNLYIFNMFHRFKDLRNRMIKVTLLSGKIKFWIQRWSQPNGSPSCKHSTNVMHDPLQSGLKLRSLQHSCGFNYNQMLVTVAYLRYDSLNATLGCLEKNETFGKPSSRQSYMVHCKTVPSLSRSNLVYNRITFSAQTTYIDRKNCKFSKPFKDHIQFTLLCFFVCSKIHIFVPIDEIAFQLALPPT